MKQILLFLLLFTTSLSFSQTTWKELKTENGVKVEYSLQEKHDNNMDIHQEFIVLKLTNTESSQKDVDVNIIFDYGYGVTSDTEGGNNNIVLNPSSSVVGDINTNYLVIFKRFLNNISNTTLINFNVEIQTN